MKKIGQSGQGLIEYALILALVVIVLAVGGSILNLVGGLLGSLLKGGTPLLALVVGFALGWFVRGRRR